MPPKSERFELRLDEGFLSRIDDWRNSQTGQPSRAEAIRVLTDIGLQAKDITRVKFSDGEKFIVAMLADSIQKQTLSAQFSPNPIISSLIDGNYWALEEIFRGIFDNKYCDPQVAFETTQILEMCQNVENSIGYLGEKERNILKYKFLNGRDDVFVGFVLRHEEAYKNAVKQILLSPTRFEVFKNRRLNDSPVGRLETYRRMYSVFNKLVNDASRGTYLSFSELEFVLDAGFGTL